MRDCPVCEHLPLESQTSHEIEVDLCTGCGGIWLDAGEFDALVGERFHGEAFEALFGFGAEGRSTRRCPADGVEMQIVHFDEIELDRCPRCHGIWIDGDERGQLRDARPVVLDHAAVAGPDLTQEWVHCGGCGEELPRLRCMRRMDAFWCEVCVIEGDYPGGYGPPISRRLRAAARSMAEAEADLAHRKHRRDQIKAASKRPPVRTQRGSYRGEAEMWAITDAVETMARSLKRLFRRRDPS